MDAEHEKFWDKFDQHVLQPLRSTGVDPVRLGDDLKAMWGGKPTDEQVQELLRRVTAAAGDDGRRGSDLVMNHESDLRRRSLGEASSPQFSRGDQVVERGSMSSVGRVVGGPFLQWYRKGRWIGN